MITDDIDDIVYYSIIYPDVYGWDDPNSQAFKELWSASQRSLIPPQCPGSFSLAWCGCPGAMAKIGPGSRQHQHRSDAPDKFTSVAGGFRMFQTSCDMFIPYPNNGMTGAPIPQLQLADFRGTKTTDQLEFDFEPLRFEFSSTWACRTMRDAPFFSSQMAACRLNRCTSTWKHGVYLTQNCWDLPTLGSLRWWGHVQSRPCVSSM